MQVVYFDVWLVIFKIVRLWCLHCFSFHFHFRHCLLQSNNTSNIVDILPLEVCNVSLLERVDYEGSFNCYTSIGAFFY